MESGRGHTRLLRQGNPPVVSTARQHRADMLADRLPPHQIDLNPFDNSAIIRT